MRLFLDRGDPVRELLTNVHFEDQALSHYARKLLTAFGTEPQVDVIEQPLLTPLSARELEVLGLIAAGRSNKEIAAELVIAIGTVKRHTVNIFNKLDVKNRTQAVSKARKLGLM